MGGLGFRGMLPYNAVMVAIGDEQAAIHKIGSEFPREFERRCNKTRVLILF